jgi:transcription elongation factor GreA
MADEQFTLTRQGYDRLKGELDQLLAEQSERQGQMEDLYRDPDRNNDEEAADFDVRTMKEYVDERVGHLQYVLERAEVLDEDPDPQRINAGDRVIVWELQARQERIFNLVSGEEVGITDDGVSIDSPVGKALLGHQSGDTIEIEVPDGWARYAIRRVESTLS